jgi:pimeloyl-ACP methyl ester carboxylesterase
VTLRVDVPGKNFPALAEALGEEARPIRDDESLDQRNAPTARWLMEHKDLLVQPDCEAAVPPPPPALIAAYGVRAQVLSPVVEAGAVAGWVSVHETRGRRHWTAHEVDAIREATRAIIEARAAAADGDADQQEEQMSTIEAQGSMIEVNGVNLWHRVTGEGEPVVQIHGAGFGHFNLDPVTPILNDHFTVVDYDQRGYGQSDKPDQHYDMEVWADDAVALMDALDIESAHIHGSSMGGMIAIVVAGKYPDRTRSAVINCAAAKLGRAGQLIFRNWIDLARDDPDGPGSRTLAELIAWQAVNIEFLEANPDVVDHIQQILTDSNEVGPYTAACQAMIDMDLTPWLGMIKAPSLVIGGDLDIMTPWDQGPNGVGQEGIYQGISGAEKYVIKGAGHSTIFDSTDEYGNAVLDFLKRNAG